MLRHVRLHEDGAALRVEAQGERLRHAVAGVVGERLGGGLDGERVQVGHEVEGVVVVLEGHPLPHGTQVVAEVERLRGGLDAREHPRTASGGQGFILPVAPGRLRRAGHRLTPRGK